MIPKITEKQKTELADDGFFVLENVFMTNEMEELAARIETYQKRHEEKLTAGSGTEGISRASEITFTDHLAEQDEKIREFVTRPEFVAVTTQILGPDIDLYWNQSVFKQPEGAREFPWHQDDGYTPVEPSPYLTLWLSLNGATEENGTISVLPGSHKQGLVEHKPSALGLVCHDNDDPNQGVIVNVPAGSMAVFHSTTFHKSGANKSKGPRKAYVIQYAPAGLKNMRTGEIFTGLIPIARGGKAVDG